MVDPGVKLNFGVWRLVNMLNYFNRVVICSNVRLKYDAK